MPGARRRGAVAVMVVISLVMIVSFAALTIDVGQLYIARGELQRAADAAALAGASGYQSDAGLLTAAKRAEWGYNADLTARVDERARACSKMNRTLQSATVLESADIIKGTFDFEHPSAPLDTSGAQPFNAVQVTTRRMRGSVNGPVTYFFAPIFGMHEGDVGATAVAAVDDRFATYDPGDRYRLLPITIHTNMYDALSETASDEYSYDTADELVQAEPDGIGETKIFPWKYHSSDVTSITGDTDGGAGAFGFLSFGDSLSSPATMATQISNGLSDDDIEQTINQSHFDFVNDAGGPLTYDVPGRPGMLATLDDVLASRIGDVVGFFIHDDVRDGGSNAVFRITTIRFGRIMDVELHGSPARKRVLIQPVAFTDPGVGVDPNAPSSDGQVGIVTLVR